LRTCVSEEEIRKQEIFELESPDHSLLSGPSTRLRDLTTIFLVGVDSLRGFRALHFAGPCVTIFGAARTKPGTDYYEKAREMGKRINRAIVPRGLRLGAVCGFGGLEATQLGRPLTGEEFPGDFRPAPKHHRPPEFAIRLRDTAVLYLDEKERDGLRPRMLHGIGWTLKLFTTAIDNPLMHEVTRGTAKDSRKTRQSILSGNQSSYSWKTAARTHAPIFRQGKSLSPLPLHEA